MKEAVGFGVACWSLLESPDGPRDWSIYSQRLHDL